ncbi:MAG: aminopeptidase P family protein [Deltaproteobacteria bacterium]|nr:aminopeptidase P family protein [Deltaproteobacteria bacterium]MBW2118525.1 aminopeptidase P family protein [Deltaproteobacteria bacterium]MBW2344958.1 aminopeptidase P family protein [Deltaproteobacteria bacterium]
MKEYMDKSIFRKRITGLRQNLARMDCDTAWIIQPENRRYMSGFRAEDSQFTESSGSLLINETLCFLTTDSRYTLDAERDAVEYDVQTLKKGLVEGLPGLLKHMGTKNLGFEGDYLTWGLHRELSERLLEESPPVHLMPLNGLVEEMRVVKDELEIRTLEESADLMSGILDEVINGLVPGMTEKQVAWQIGGLVRESGAEGLAFQSIVASGPNSAFPHAVPTDRKLEKGAPVILDVGLRLKGYCSDMTRTVFLGDPSPDFMEIYRTVREAQTAALKEVRSGVMSNHPDAVAREVINDAGFGDYFGHGLGHGVGLATHERPRLSPLKPSKLEKGMVMTVEPGIYIPGKGGVRLEEMVVIEADGPRVLTKAGNFYDFTS